MFDHSTDFQKALNTLDSIRQNYSPESEECKTLETAAHAFLYVFSEEVRDKFLKWRESVDGDLTKEQEEHLHMMGINPDTGEDLF